ncbi:hypothetical protein [Actinomadura gamaensis]|uniref:Uncharacterized protein n=1 Tax=Actinomadura gamaensis TaxID=1763541 RepID=A0ABV9U1E8_9ACTN
MRLGARADTEPKIIVPAISTVGPSASGRVRRSRVLSALRPHPRPDATASFGSSEDEVLEDRIQILFIPGNPDAALAYLEPELAIRRNAGASSRRRLLLADWQANFPSTPRCSRPKPDPSAQRSQPPTPPPPCHEEEQDHA